MLLFNITQYTVSKQLICYNFFIIFISFFFKIIVKARDTACLSLVTLYPGPNDSAWQLLVFVLTAVSVKDTVTAKTAE
jgi:hypothetical protein